MKILIIGSGGREHALLKKISQSPKVTKIFCCPGNAGMQSLAECVSLAVENISGLVEFAQAQHIDFTIVGPEIPLSLGIVNEFEKQGLKIFGPSQEASVLESSKIFTKEFCARHQIPTAGFAIFSQIDEAKKYVSQQKNFPLVLKADGLAGGKGVLICENLQETHEGLDSLMLANTFGDAGKKIVIEEFMPGEEASFFIITDGQNFIEFPAAQDHKRIFDGDLGPNTGGMGAYAPAPVFTEQVRKRVIETIVKPTLLGMQQEGRIYKGVLYVGLMIGPNGDVRLVEFNCRFGDPEAEVLLPLLKTDFLEIVEASLAGRLSEVKMQMHPGAAVGVVLASEGYPGAYQKGQAIQGLNTIHDSNVFVFHAGTQKQQDRFLTDGGRVLVVVAHDESLRAAKNRVYQSVNKISWSGMQYRQDIADKGLKHLERDLMSAAETKSKILPFKAMLYNHDKIESLADVVTPPYDVINPDMQAEFYDRSPYNFCRVDFPKEEGDARYQIAQKIFAQWSEEKVFIQDEKPAIYVHHHTFTLSDGSKITRKGFFAACRVEDYSEGGVRPHEKTLEGPKADRLKITRATQTNLSPVFSLYADAQKTIDQKFSRLTQTTPFFDFVSCDEERHQLWKMTDQETCDFLNSFLQDKDFFIADGHHRYETALNYMKEVTAQNSDLPMRAGPRYLLMYFSNMKDDGLIILPIHRAVHHLKNFNLATVLDKLSSHFEIQEINKFDEQETLAGLAKLGSQHHAFCMLTKDPSKTFMLSLKKEAWQKHPLAKNLHEALRGLDVTVLHRLVLEEILGISEAAQANQENLIYWKSTEKAIHETHDGHCDLTFLLNPTRIEDMESVASAGLKMPQKSTFFYPKIISGLVMHSVKPDSLDGFAK